MKEQVPGALLEVRGQQNLFCPLSFTWISGLVQQISLPTEPCHPPPSDCLTACSIHPFDEFMISSSCVVKSMMRLKHKGR